MGKTRGGRNSKVMALTDRKGRLMNFIVVEGQCYGGKHVRILLPRWQKWKVVREVALECSASIKRTCARHWR